MISNSRIISTDEDPSLRIKSSAIIYLRGVSTKLNKYIMFTVQTCKELIKFLVINLLAIPSQPFTFIFDFCALLADNHNRNKATDLRPFDSLTHGLTKRGSGCLGTIFKFE